MLAGMTCQPVTTIQPFADVLGLGDGFRPGRRSRTADRPRPFSWASRLLRSWTNASSTGALADRARVGYGFDMQAFDLPPAPLVEDGHGVIRIAGSRVTLDSIVALFDRGATAEEIVQSFPTLALADVYATLSYVVVR